MDDELLSIAKTAIGAEIGLTAAQSRRLSGTSAAELRADALDMGRELGIVADAPPAPRDHGGRFAAAGGIYDQRERGGLDMNRLIREASGRTT
jgi:hypothetical protein